MKQLPLIETANRDNFYEVGYLLYNKDVEEAVSKGLMTAKQHFQTFGIKERRLQIANTKQELEVLKEQKHERIKAIMRDDMQSEETLQVYDYLTSELRGFFNIIDCDLVSSHSYDEYGLALIEKYKDGIILDCGAGNRPTYYSNVVNFEIAEYPSTDVRGVGEVLPFKDNSFDAIISIAVLEHVKDPFLCVREMARVLKPGGEIVCSVPFLQPFHGYPHHYYNMTYSGLKNIFEEVLSVDEIIVPQSLEPIWSLTWILNSWARGLDSKTKEEFLQLKVKDLIEPVETQLEKEYVKRLEQATKSEIASGHMLLAHKLRTKNVV